MNDQLLPCPFCGDIQFSKMDMVYIHKSGTTKGFRIKCGTCGAQAPDTCWNHRVAPPASAHGDEAVPADLKARCREIAQWRKSGVLRGDALRKYAESRWPGDPSALQMAEHETATEAFQVVSAMRAQAGEGGEV